MKKCNLSYSKKSVEQWHRMEKERISKGDDYAVREDRKKTTKTKEEISSCSTRCISEK